MANYIYFKCSLFNIKLLFLFQWDSWRNSIYDSFMDNHHIAIDRNIDYIQKRKEAQDLMHSHTLS